MYDRGCIFDFNYTATTEIYTDWHTLSRLDALPISGSAPAFDRSGRRPRHPVPPCGLRLANCRRRYALEEPRDAQDGCPRCEGLYECAFRAARSEKHTSELQSLMRISYAVFCLTQNTANRDMNTLISSARYSM